MFGSLDVWKLGNDFNNVKTEAWKLGNDINDITAEAEKLGGFAKQTEEVWKLNDA